MRTQQQAIEALRSEADSLIRLASRRRDEAQTWNYLPEDAILVETAINMQDEANRIEAAR